MCTCTQMNGKQIRGKTIKVELFRSKEDRMENKLFTNVYVKYIPSSWDENKLISIFEFTTDGHYS